MKQIARRRLPHSKQPNDMEIIMDITGKNIIITGGARGMGKKFAVDLKDRGAKPYVVDVVQENLDALKKRDRHSGPGGGC